MPVYRPVQPPPPPPAADPRRELLAAIEELPPLPRILDRLLAVLDDGNTSCAQAAAIIEKDTVLAGNVLRCVNSAYYGLPANVSSIRHAVSLLGLSTIRNHALAFALRRMIKGARTPPAKLYARYAQHSLACGLLAHYLGQQSAPEISEAAFASGLFHDIGKLLILSTFPNLLPAIMERYELGEVDWEAAEEEVVGITHSQISALVLEKWKLPALMQRAVQHHHRPAECQDQEAAALAAIVHAADVYVNQMGLEILPTRRQGAYPTEATLQDVGFQEQMSVVVERFKTEYEGMRGLF